MAVAGTQESWDNGGLTFGQPSVGGSREHEEEMLDDRAILKAFDDALNTHTRKPVDGVEARKWNKHAAKEVAAQPSTAGSSRVPPSLAPAATPRRAAASSNPNTPARRSSAGPPAAAAAGYQQGQGQGFPAADRRFASLLAKGGADASSRAAAGEEARVLPAGIPGPWEPVAAGPGEGQQYSREVPPDDRGQRFEFVRPGPSEVYPRGEEYGNGAHSHSFRATPHYPPAPHPPAAGLEDGDLGRHGLPPPPPPPPHPGVGAHAAAFQSLDGVPDDDLADLLLAWYYSGYYTGRYRAMQEARKPRNQYRRNYPPPPSAGGHGGHPPHHGNNHGPPPTPSSAYHGAGGEGWGGDPSGGWHGHQHRPPPLSAPAGPPPSMQSSPAAMGGRGGSFGRRGS
eukprot:g11236.t1